MPKKQTSQILQLLEVQGANEQRTEAYGAVR